MQHVLAEIAEEEGRHGGGIDDELAVFDREANAGERPAHRAFARVLAERSARELSSLRLAVPVANLETRRLAPRAEHLRIERLARGHHPAQVGHRAQAGALGDHAVLGRRHAEHVHALALEQLEALVRVEARVMQERRGSTQPRRDEHVAGRLRPAAGRGAPDQLPRAGGHPMACLEALTVEVALAVDDRLRLSGRAARESQQARILLAQLHGGLRIPGEQRLVGHVEGRRLVAPQGGLKLGAVALVGDDQRGAGHADPQTQILCPELLRAGQDDRADTQAGQDREDPLRPVADQRHHDVPPSYSARGQGAREARRTVGNLAEGPLAPAAVARNLDERQLVRGPIEDLAGEVHAGILPGDAENNPGAPNRWP